MHRSRMPCPWVTPATPVPEGGGGRVLLRTAVMHDPHNSPDATEGQGHLEALCLGGQ